MRNSVRTTRETFHFQQNKVYLWKKASLVIPKRQLFPNSEIPKKKGEEEENKTFLDSNLIGPNPMIEMSQSDPGGQQKPRETLTKQQRGWFLLLKIHFFPVESAFIFQQNPKTRT